MNILSDVSKVMWLVALLTDFVRLERTLGEQFNISKILDSIFYDYNPTVRPS